MANKSQVRTNQCLLGSGIFILPATVLRGTDSIGISLIIWAFAGIVAIGALLVWLELSLTLPRYDVNGNQVSVPRSGGEKNYVSTIQSIIAMPAITSPS